jgi:hypothetical protein
MADIQFEENQRFREIAFFILIGIVQLIFIWALTQRMFFNKPLSKQPAPLEVLIFFNIVVLAFFLLINSINLNTVITEKQISIKLFPLQFKEKIVNWSDVKDVKIVKYDGIKDYGGFGRRYKSSKGWSYTISGPFGIRIILNDGSKILIGTHKEKEVAQIIEDLKAEGIIV